MKKAKKTTISRKPFKQRLWEAEVAGVQRGHDVGWKDGVASVQREFGPNVQHQKNITDTVRMIESWGNMSDNGVIMIAGTDLQHHCNAAIPLRLLRLIGEELKRLGYKP